MKKALVTLSLLCVLVGCHSNEKDEKKEEPVIKETSESVIEEPLEEEIAIVDFNSVPLTLVESHRVHQSIENVELLFADMTSPYFIDHTNFFLLSYLPKKEATFYMNGSTLMKRTATDSIELGEIDYND